MGRFINTGRHFVNIDHIRYASYDWKEKSGNLFLTENHSIHSDRVSELLSDIPIFAIPAAPGLMATIIYYNIYDERPESFADLHIFHQPIIGWRIYDDYSTPIYIDRPSDNAMHFLEVDNQLHQLYGDGAIYDSMEDAKQAALETAQSEWQAVQNVRRRKETEKEQ